MIKLDYYGIRGAAKDWISNYLENRQQCVLFNNTISSLQTVTYGVPQGSILGPLLFILYINDIQNCSNFLYFILFADDTNVIASDPDWENLIKKLTAELQKLSEWFAINKLSLNIKKTNFMIFGSKRILNKNFKLIINREALVEITSFKFLGIFIDSKLTWKNHINFISNKLARNIGIIKKLQNKLSGNSLALLYNILVQPHLYYCTILWGGAYSSNLLYLQRLHKRALRLITFSKFNAHADPLFSRLKILKIKDIYKLQILTYIYKCKYNQIRNGLSNSENCTFRNTHGYNTRNLLCMKIPFSKSNIRRFCIKHTGPALWNETNMYLHFDQLSSVDELKLSFTSILTKNYKLSSDMFSCH